MELVTRDKEDSANALMLAHSYRNLARVRLLIGQTIAAREAILAALAINEELVKRVPKSPLYRNNLAMSLTRLSHLEARQGRRQEAFALQERALPILNGIADENGSVPDNIVTLGNEISELADFYADAGQLTKAMDYYAQAIRILDDWREKNHSFRIGLIQATINLARAQHKSMAQPDAESSWRSAVKMINSLAEKDRDSVAWGYHGQALYYLNEFATARTALERAIELGGNNQPNAIRERWWYLSMTLHQLGEVKLAREYYDQLTQQLNDNFLGYDYCQFRAETARVIGVIPTSP